MTRIWSLKPRSLMSILSLKPLSCFIARAGVRFGWAKLPSRKAFLHKKDESSYIQHFGAHLQQSSMMQMRASSLIALGCFSSPQESPSNISSLGDPSRISQIISSIVICSPALNSSLFSSISCSSTCYRDEHIPEDLFLVNNLLLIVLLQLPSQLTFNLMFTVA